MMVSRQERDAGQFRLLSALNAPSYCRWHGHTLGLPWLWARVCHLCWGWEPHCWVLHRWSTNRTSSLRVLGCKAGDRRQQMDTGRQGKYELVLRGFQQCGWQPSHPPSHSGFPGKSQGWKGPWQQLRGFWSWLINPANVTAIQGPLPPGPFLPFQLFFALTWEMLGGRYALGFCLLCQQYWGDSWPERVCFAGVSSHSVHLCSPSTCL